MEQRASALQARLEARRNMFMKAEQNTNFGSNRPPGKNYIVFFYYFFKKIYSFQIPENHQLKGRNYAWLYKER